jgi:hypothetical protein
VDGCVSVSRMHLPAAHEVTQHKITALKEVEERAEARASTRRFCQKPLASTSALDETGCAKNNCNGM